MVVRRWIGGLLALAVGVVVSASDTGAATRTTKKKATTTTKAAAPAFAMQFSDQITGIAGAIARIPITVTRRSGTAAVTLKAARVPDGWTMAATANPVQDTTTLVVRIPATATTGSYRVSVAGSDGKSLVRISPTVVVAAAPVTTPTVAPTTQPPIPVVVTTQPNLSPTSTIVPPTVDFNLLGAPTAQAVRPGQTATFTITVNRSGGFAQTVDLVATGVPANSTAFFTPNPAGDTAFLQVATQTTTPLGSFDITILGRNRSTRVTLIVSNDAQPTGSGGSTTTTLFPAAFAMTANPAQQAVGATGTAVFAIGITGPPSPVSFTVSTLPPGATFGFGAAPTVADTTLTITTNGVAPGTYPFTVQGVAGTTVRSVGLTLVVGSVGSGFGLRASNDSISVSRSGAGTLAISIVPNAGFSLPVNFSLGALPGGVNASLSPTTSTTGTQLTIAPQASAFTGTNVITVTATSAGLVATIQITVNIT